MNFPFLGSKERDNETGLDFFEARYLASIQGRFASPDSFGGSILNPQTLNLYAYVQNNPLAFADPTGHFAEEANDKKKKIDIYVDWKTWAKVEGKWYGQDPKPTPRQDNLTPAGTDAQGKNVYNCPSCDVRLVDDSPPGPPSGQQQFFNALSYSYGPMLAAGNFLSTSKLSGGGFGYAGVGAGVGPVHFEGLGLVQYDSEEGGSHGALLGAAAGHFTFGYEWMRTWHDWQEHSGPIVLGGKEILGPTRFFGRQVNSHSRDFGGLAQYEGGHLSLGIYGGITMGSGRAYGGGGYFTYDPGLWVSPWNAPIIQYRGQ